MLLVEKQSNNTGLLWTTPTTRALQRLIDRANTWGCSKELLENSQIRLNIRQVLKKCIKSLKKDKTYMKQLESYFLR